MAVGGGDSILGSGFALPCLRREPGINQNQLATTPKPLRHLVTNSAGEARSGTKSSPLSRDSRLGLAHLVEHFLNARQHEEPLLGDNFAIDQHRKLAIPAIDHFNFADAGLIPQGGRQTGGAFSRRASDRALPDRYLFHCRHSFQSNSQICEHTRHSRKHAKCCPILDLDLHQSHY